MKIPLENYYHRAAKMIANINVSGRARAKRLGIKHDYSHVNICKEDIAVKLQKIDKLVCELCDTPIKIWEIGSYSCISCDRHINPKAPYSIENIRFVHNRCNSQDGVWRKINKKKTVEDFRESLTKVGVMWCESTSDEARIVFEKNQEYFRSNLSKQIKMEKNMNKKNMNKKNTDNELERISVGGVRFELEPHRVEWYLKVLLNVPNQTPHTSRKLSYSNNENSAGVPEVRRWIETLKTDTKITTSLVKSEFGNRMNPMTINKVLCSLLKTKKGRKLIYRLSPGVYRRVETEPVLV